MARKSNYVKILTRGYGLSVNMGRGKGNAFITPLKHAIGAMMVEGKEQLNKRINDKAKRKGVDPLQLREDFFKGLKRRGYSADFEGIKPTDIVQNVKRYGDVVTAGVRKNDGVEEFNRVSFDSPSVDVNKGRLGYKDLRCQCADNQWSDTKGRKVVCSHLAALETALFLDVMRPGYNVGNLGKNRFVDTATPVNLSSELPSMPFDFHQSRDVRRTGSRMLTDLLFAYFTEGQSMADANAWALENPAVYSQVLKEMIGNKYDLAQFQVLRQKRSNEQKGLTLDRKILMDCAVAAEHRFEQIMKDREECFSNGYGLEFKGTRHETVGKRFVDRKRDLVYSFVIDEETDLPLVVRKKLDEKKVDFFLTTKGKSVSSSITKL
jgi:hypothetical protein